MKKKITIGPFKFKISFTPSKFFNNFFQKNIYYEAPLNNIDPNKLLEYKIYRIFKEQHCVFYKGNDYSKNGTQPTSYIYYKSHTFTERQLEGFNLLNCEKIQDSCVLYKIPNLTKDKNLLGELMFGQDKIEFFKSKNILIKETIGYYFVVQGSFVLGIYDKDWLNKQGIYQ